MNDNPPPPPSTGTGGPSEGEGPGFSCGRLDGRKDECKSRSECKWHKRTNTCSDGDGDSEDSPSYDNNNDASAPSTYGLLENDSPPSGGGGGGGFVPPPSNHCSNFRNRDCKDRAGCSWDKKTKVCSETGDGGGGGPGSGGNVNGSRNDDGRDCSQYSGVKDKCIQMDGCDWDNRDDVCEAASYKGGSSP